jgi:glycosyltransferase involved in cell wall biosynthesis
MSKISAIILTKNSENQIADCIESLSFCEEIIVIDDNSTDRTADLAKRLGAKVEQPDFDTNNFAAKRNYGIKKSKNKWILYIDSDERVSTELKDDIIEVTNEKKPGHVAYRILRKNFYFGSHEWPFIEKFPRLFKKSALKEWRGELHETPIIEGSLGQLNGFILHYTHRDLSSMVNKTLDWSKIEAELRFNANHPKMTWWRFPRVMLTAFFDSYIKQKGYKAGTAGLIESLYQSFSIFITYARLWELQQQKKEIK